MGNCASICAKTKTTDNNDSCGNTNLNIDSAKKVHIEPHVDKSKHTTTIITHKTSDGEVITSQQSCCEKIDDDGNKQCDRFRTNLRQFYQKLTLPNVPWINEEIDLPIAEYFTQLELKESDKSIEIEEIFNSVNGKQPTRILFEGQPGFGKTALATKLAYDWANNEEYIDFEFSFFIPLRELEKKSMEVVLVEIGNRCDFEDITQIVKKHKKQTLFILDGLDEISREERQEIMKILFKQKYSDVTVIVLCRTSHFTVSKEERKEIFGFSNVSGAFYDKRISLLGAKNNFRHILLNSKLFDSPLFRMLSPVVIAAGVKIEEIATTTEFYKKIFNATVKHNCEISQNNNIDLFDVTSFPMNNIQEQIRHFGLLSAEKIVQNDLKFDSNELTEEIRKMGFLINRKELIHCTSKKHYEGLNLSIMEFAAAYAFFVELKVNDMSASTEKLLKEMANHYYETRGTSQVLQFLASLLEDDLDRLLAFIDSCCAWFSIDFDLAASLVVRCSENNISNSKYQKNFIRPHE
uniref:NACHT domain-containing protein n=1 Tax=Strigamia maritima TaxID=126957 RepID=T1J987_STRMM